MRRRHLLYLLLSWLSVTVYGQPRCTIVHYDEEDGLPHGHVTQLLQDELGFMWFATWNGLCRYDGYEFCTFKPATGDGCHIATDRFRDIALCPDGRMVCRVDDDYYWFDTHTCQFSDMTDGETQQAADLIKHYRQSISLKSIPDSLASYMALLPMSGGSFALTDRQGILWVLADNGIYKVCKNQQFTERVHIAPKAQMPFRRPTAALLDSHEGRRCHTCLQQWRRPAVRLSGSRRPPAPSVHELWGCRLLHVSVC